MPDWPLDTLLSIAGLLTLAGIALGGLGSLSAPPAYERGSRWRRVAPLWGGILFLEGILLGLFWIWSADLDGDGPPASFVVLLVLLTAIVLVPIGFGLRETFRRSGIRARGSGGQAR